MPFPLFVFASGVIAAATMAATYQLSRMRTQAAVVALVGSMALLLFHGLGYFRLFVDDAFIILRYSRHLADGLGPIWNDGERAEGYTSFLWMAILAGTAKIGFDLVVAARILAFLALAATFFLVYRIWTLWANEEPGTGIDSPVVLAAALLGLALVDGVAFWGFSGMETAAFMALLTGSAYLYLQERRRRGFPWSAVALAATAMARPEGLIAVAVTGAFVFADALRQEERERALLRALGWGGVFAVLYGPYFIWRYSYYDYLLPNTFYAKVGPSSAIYDRGLTYVSNAALNYHLLPMFAGGTLLLTLPRLRWDAAYVTALIATMLAGIVYEGGDAFGHGRFIAPLLPLSYLSGLAGLATLVKGLSLRPAQIALVVALVLGSGGLLLLRGSNNPFIPIDRGDHEERRLLGTWFSEHTPPDFKIAAFAVGAFGYYSDRYVLDMLGLNDVFIAHFDVPNFGKGVGGHEKYNTDYVLDTVRPEIIIRGDAVPEPLTAEEVKQIVERRTSPVEAANELYNDPRLWDRYAVRAVNIEGRWFNFFQRKDTLAELQGPGLR